MATGGTGSQIGLPKDISDHIKKHGVSTEYLEQISEELLWYQKVKLNIAVVGQSRQGKSSLINVMMGLKWNSPDGAEVSAEGETTNHLKSYKHPINPKLVLWDCPGIDGSNFKRETYFNDIKAKEIDYDFYLIVSNDIFSDTALYLAKCIREEYKKRFYFIRTKVDSTLDEMEENEERQNVTEAERVKKIKGRVENKVRSSKYCPEKFKVYMVSNREPHKFEFEDLQTDIVRESPELIREAYLMTIASWSTKLNQLKYDMLYKRAWKVALLSGVGTLVPIPGVSASVDLNILVEEAINYVLVFNLPAKSVKSREKVMGRKEGELNNCVTSHLNERSMFLEFVRNFDEITPEAKFEKSQMLSFVAHILQSAKTQMAAMIVEIAASEVAEKMMEGLLILIGWVLAAVTSYAVTLIQLMRLLKAAKSAADCLCEK